MDERIQNVRLAIRNLRRTPSFTLTAVLTLALGVGLSTAVFTVAQAVILRQLPVADQDRVVFLSGSTRDANIQNYPLGLNDAAEYSRRTRTLEQVAWVTYEGASPRVVRLGDQLVRLRRALVSGNYFQTLGTKPVIGRALRREDDHAGASPVVVLSYRIWQERFGGAQSVLGSRIASHEDGLVYTVVGVLPSGFEFPKGSDLWATIRPSVRETTIPYMAANLVGRLRAGSTPLMARDEMTTFFLRAEASEASRSLTGAVLPFAEVVTGEARGAILVFALAAVFLLFITCVNVGNLLFVRGIGRVREIAVRTALGASRADVVRMMVRENVLIAAAGCVASVVVAALAISAFVAFAPPGLPRRTEIHLDAGVLIAAVGISVFSLLAFGILPAFLSSRVESQAALRSGARQSGSRKSRIMTELAASTQIGLATMVLVAAALLGRSFLKLRGIDLAFDPSRIVVAELALRTGFFPDVQSQMHMLRELTAAIENIPGVEAVTPVVAVPFSGSAGWDGKLSAEGQSDDEARANPMLNMEVVSPTYFRTFNVSITGGRVFNDSDRAGSQPVVMLSESAARHFWPRGDAVEKRVFMGRGVNRRAFVVAGIVTDTRYRDIRDARASVYFPLEQSFFPFAPTTIAFRSGLAAGSVGQSLRRAIDENAAGVELASARPFNDFIALPLAQPRLNAMLLAVFGTAAVALSAIGLFGVLATMVRQRRHEFGVRMALGAQTQDVQRMVLRRAVTLTSIGVMAGTLGSLATNRALASLVFGVSTSDTFSFVVVALVLIGCGVIASVIPAMWTGRIQPVLALRSD